MRAPGLNRRARDFLLIMAQLALVAYLFQVLAVDHWRYDPSHTIGIEGTQVHIQHCHGDVSGCTDGIGSAPTSGMGEIISLPLPPMATLEGASVADDSPNDAFIATPSEPPRAS
jgi:hypothetical protein